MKYLFIVIFSLLASNVMAQDSDALDALVARLEAARSDFSEVKKEAEKKMHVAKQYANQEMTVAADRLEAAKLRIEQAQMQVDYNRLASRLEQLSDEFDALYIKLSDRLFNINLRLNEMEETKCQK